MSEILLKHPYATISWEDDFKGLYIQVQGFLEGTPFREILEQVLELSKARKADRLLVNLSEQKVTSVADQNWIIQDWVPRFQESGIRYGAMLLPNDIIGHMSMDRIVHSLGPIDIQYQFFTSVDEAHQWLMSR